MSIASILSHKRKVVGVQTTDKREIPTKRVIVCAGVFSSRFGVKVRPIKGEILTLKSPYTLTSMIRSPRLYLAPKPQNKIRLGATQIEKGYDLTLSILAIRTLLQEAWEVLPAIDEMELITSEVGLRPCTDNGLPIIEKADLEGLYHATGHGRAGFLLAPYTAKLIKEKVLCALH